MFTSDAPRPLHSFRPTRVHVTILRAVVSKDTPLEVHSNPGESLIGVRLFSLRYAHAAMFGNECETHCHFLALK